MKINKILNKVFMAFAKGNESTEGNSIVRYIGVAPVNVLSINPTKAELEGFFNTELENEPEYLGESEVDGNKVPYARITFITKPVAEKVGMDVAPISISLFVRKEFKMNRDNTKVQVIDEYGNTGWATKEECANHSQLLSKAGKALKISTNYRPAYNGEAELTDFIKAFLNIPDAFEYTEGNWKLKKDADMSIARFENVENMFKGDFTEIKDAIAFQPDNKIKILFGVRKNDEGKMYQTFYKEMFLKNSVNDYSKLDKDVQERKNNGGYANTDFNVCPFKVYDIKATDFNEVENNVDPFAANTDAAPANPWFN
jgi:hypothetical protein